MTRFLNRISIDKRLRLINLYLFLAILLLLYLTIRGVNSDIRFNQLEIKGAQYLRPLVKLLQLLPEQQSRGRLTSNNSPAINAGTGNDAMQIDQAFADLRLLHAAFSKDLQLTDAALTSRDKPDLRLEHIELLWKTIKIKSATLTPDESNLLYAHLLADVRNLITYLGDTSNLILDPDLDSYYLMYTAIVLLPPHQERLFKLAGDGEEILAGKPLTPDIKKELAIQAALLEQADAVRINSSLQTALAEDARFSEISTGLQKNIPPLLNTYNAAISDFIKLANTLANEQTSAPSRQDWSRYLESCSQTANAGFALWNATNNEMETLIRKRVDSYQRARLEAMLWAFLSLTFSFLLVNLVLGSINNQLGELVKLLDGSPEQASHAIQQLQKDGSKIGATARLIVQFLEQKSDLITQVRERKNAEESLRQSEERTRLIIDTALDAVVSMDHAGLVTGWNAQAQHIFGWTKQEVLGHKISSLIIPPQYRQSHEQGLAQFLATGKGPVLNKRIEITALHKNGDEFPVELSVTPLRTGSSHAFSAFIRDITQRKRAEEMLCASEERYALTERGSNDGLWDWNLKTNKVYYSSRCKTILGYEPDHPDDTPDVWLNRIDPLDKHQFQLDLNLHLSGQSSHFQNEHKICTITGETRWALARAMAVRDESDQAVRLAGSLSDITDRKAAEDKLRLAAQTDKLTGLPNRAVVIESVSQAIIKSKMDAGYKFGVLFLDFDRFKIINDSLGHEIGDMLLIEIASRLRNSLRKGDTICLFGDEHIAARLGGDEFVLLLDGIKSEQDASLVAERLQKDLNKPYILKGHEVFSSASIGIVTGEAGHETAEDLIRDADTAMYHAKTSGKARHVVFHAGMREAVTSRLTLESDLRRALEQKNQLLLFYQPIVSLTNGELLGFEALLRWKHPDRGMISPADFIPIAEETGLIVPIGNWTLHQACRQLKTWQTQYPEFPPLAVSVNLSVRQMNEPNIVEEIREVLTQTNIDPRTLKLEITESLLVENAQSVSLVLSQLKALQVQLLMDDFGTGYSSLSCLHQYPLDGIKIDRSFLNTMSNSVAYAAVVHAIVTLAHNLHIKVVAEGVETSDQVVQLQSLECDWAQGYLFSKPMPADDATAYIAKKLRLHAASRAG